LKRARKGREKRNERRNASRGSEGEAGQPLKGKKRRIRVLWFCGANPPLEVRRRETSGTKKGGRKGDLQREEGRKNKPSPILLILNEKVRLTANQVHWRESLEEEEGKTKETKI